MSMRPPLKYAGSKYRILDRIRDVLPKSKRFVEPFLGSAAVFLNMEGYEQYLIGDANPTLINLYTVLRDEGREFVEYSRTFFSEENNTPERYYELRDVYNTTDDIRLKSAITVYVNRFGFNGLMRQNRSGKFNVPFGRYKKPYFPERELLALAEKLKRAELYCGDFSVIEPGLTKGDVCYLDPPYIPYSPTANFTDYHADGFGLDKQTELAEFAERVSQSGITVVISNHDTPVTRQLYKTAEIISFEVPRFISCDASNRKPVKEMLAVYKAV